MILILSENKCQSTNDVIEYLRQLGANYIRINDNEKVKLIMVELTNNSKRFVINYNGKDICSDSIGSVWIRRGFFNLDIDLHFIDSIPFIYRKQLNNHLKMEHTDVLRLISYILENKYCIGSFEGNTLTKMKILNAALKAGLKIPSTFITDNKMALESFSHKIHMITKTISTNFFITNQSMWGHCYTTFIKESEFFNFPNKFYLSLFQEFIKKEYEIKACYIKNQIYAVAILNKKQHVDIRMLNDNSIIPYELSLDIRKKIIKMMRYLNLNFGTIDMVQQANNCNFLEVNPVGQFGFFSNWCNVNIEKKIATSLYEEDKQYIKNKKLSK